METPDTQVQKTDSNGEYNSFLVFGTRFDIDKKYEIIDPMGSGAYGIVVAAKDTEIEDEENNLVAIKKIERAFEHKVFM